MQMALSVCLFVRQSCIWTENKNVMKKKSIFFKIISLFFRSANRLHCHQLHLQVALSCSCTGHGNKLSKSSCWKAATNVSTALGWSCNIATNSAITLPGL